jgi:chromosomal replication initiator protein
MPFSTDVKNLNFGASLDLPVGLSVLEWETPPVTDVENEPLPPGPSPADLWGSVLERLRALVHPQSYSTWFEPTRLAAVGEGEIVVEGPNQFFVDWLEEHHLNALEDAVEQVLGRRPLIRFAVATGGEGAERIVRTPDRPARLSPRPETSSEPDGLNPRYTFAEFVVGPNSRLAHAACLAVSEKPGRVYNPLFLYGGVGLGKTHLMHAIGRFVREALGLRVSYVSSEAFMNDMIWAIRQGKTFEFRNRYRSVDVLLVDDVQFLSGKGGTQEEFFHTFNHLYAAHKQIVVACDRPPKEIDALEERLLSRFESGLITDLAAPDFETRVAILRRKVENERTPIPDEVLQRIARSVTSNIRELEGSLIRLIAFSSLTGQPLNLQTAEEALQEFLRPQRRDVRVHQIQKLVASEFGIGIEGMKSKTRTAKITFPRQVAIFLTRELTQLPLVEIGKRFGGRDHTTILHAYGKIASAARQDAALQERLDRMRRTLLF